MLHRVREYGLKTGESEPGFKPQQIRWAIVFDCQGNYLGVEELGDTEQARNPGLRIAKCPTIEQTGDVIWSQFLWSDLRKMLAWGKNAQDRKAAQCQAFFLDLLREAKTICPALEACARSLGAPETRQVVISDLARKAKSSETATIRIGDDLPVCSPEAIEWWRSNRISITGRIGGGRKKAAEAKMRCLLSGELAIPARIHPFVKGMSDVGGNAKSALVSFNEAAYRSYRLEKSANAAMSETSAAEYTDALNRLIETRSRRLISYRAIRKLRKGKSDGSGNEAVWVQEKGRPGQDAKVILWFDRHEVNETVDAEVLLDPSAFEGADRREAAQAEQRGLSLLTAIQRGERPDLAGARYLSAILSSATSRVMVRSWQEGPLTEFAEAVCRWFSDLEIADIRTGEKARDPAFARLVGAMARKKSDVGPALVLSLWLAAVHNSEISDAVMAQVLKRLRVEIVSGEEPRAEAAALLKASLIRKARSRKEHMETLESVVNENHPDPAYHCGRLMAVLAAVQRQALGDVGAGVIQRYFTSASATPCLVFGRLVRNSQHHLEKLKPGLRWVIEGKIASIEVKIGDRYPASLGLERQSLFALGYYQQIAEDRRMQRIHQPKKEQEANA